MENITYRVERSAYGNFVGCYYGRETPGETVSMYSMRLPRVAWWELLPWQECPAFETGNNDLGCFVLACSILSHHFQEMPALVGQAQSSKSKTYGRFFGFAIEVIRTQQLKPGEFYMIDSEVINEWLAMKTPVTTPETQTAPAA